MLKMSTERESGKRYKARKEELYEESLERTESYIERGWERLAEEDVDLAAFYALIALDRMEIFPRYFLVSSSYWVEEKGIEERAIEWQLEIGPLVTSGREAVKEFRPGGGWNHRPIIESLENEGYPIFEEFCREMRSDRLVKREVVTKSLGVCEEIARQRYGLFDDEEPTHKIGEDFEESPFWELWKKRRRQGRIMSVLIVARDGQTGVGKSTLGVALAKEMDSEWSAEKATNRAWEYREQIQREPKGSVLLADEFAQMFDARRSMSKENVESSQDWQMIRKLQVSTIGTTPSMAEVDTRFLKLMDLQMLVTRRGYARVYKMKIDDEDGSLYREHFCNIEWPDLSDDPDYQRVEEMKEERLEKRLLGNEDEEIEDSGSITPEQRRGVRNELIEELAESDLTQKEIAEALEIDPSTVSRITN